MLPPGNGSRRARRQAMPGQDFHPTSRNPCTKSIELTLFVFNLSGTSLREGAEHDSGMGVDIGFRCDLSRPGPGKPATSKTVFRSEPDLSGPIRFLTCAWLNRPAVPESAKQTSFFRDGSCDRRRSSGSEGLAFTADHGRRFCGWRNCRLQRHHQASGSR